MYRVGIIMSDKRNTVWLTVSVSVSVTTNLDHRKGSCLLRTARVRRRRLHHSATNPQNEHLPATDVSDTAHRWMAK